MFHTLDATYPRHAHFRHYLDNVRCTYSLTVQIDITKLRARLKARGLKAYPAQIHLLANTVNNFPAFRMGLTDQGAPGYWEVSHPSYAIFNPKRETFCSIWTHYEPDFEGFYQACAADIARYQAADAFMPKENVPNASFDISSVPWVDFTAFNLNVYAEGTHLAPIFTLGKYVEEGGKTLLPLALQVHHAACDGYHAGQFIDALRTRAAECQAWL